MLIRVALAMCFLGVVGSCAATHKVAAETPYKTYSDVAFNTVGVWTRTEIHVPRGAVVAIMAQGECWNVKQPMKKHLDPTASVRFKIGERGVRRNLVRLYESQHVNVIKSPREGPLFVAVAPFLKEKKNWQARISGTVLVWEKSKADRVESDIRDLIQAHPDDKKFQALVFPLAGKQQSGGRQRIEHPEEVPELT